jgi:hypothetical protein
LVWDGNEALINGLYIYITARRPGYHIYDIFFTQVQKKFEGEKEDEKVKVPFGDLDIWAASNQPS